MIVKILLMKYSSNCLLKIEDLFRVCKKKKKHCMRCPCGERNEFMP